jgi:hypothetical protein
MKYFTLLQHQSTYLKQLSKIIINKDQRAKLTKQKELTSSEQNKGGKQKLNAVLAKENTHRTIRVKTRVF